jgi:DnaJ-class molecular chaperone
MEAIRINAERPEAVASAVIAWWMDRLCKTCHGRKFDKIENTPALSAIECPVCHGSGETRIPHGEIGRRLASWLDECKHAHVDIIKRRLAMR